ncbi:MAG TPA: hypothetical protein GX695_05740 [Acholeplasmataceae bacterium]|nr:hypothetical protein [Acholeplasmataceae bacterium]
MKDAVYNVLSKKVNLFVVHTPFHLVQLERMIADDVIDKRLPSIVFYSVFVNRNSVHELFDYNSCQIFLLPKNTFSLKQLFKKIVINSVKLNRLIQKYNSIIKDVFLNTNFTTVILFTGTDKDIFDQTLFFYIDKYFTNIKIVFDEGVGLYVKENYYSKGVNFLFSMCTKVLFKVPLISINKLGSHPKSQIIYARYPELIFKEKNKQYFKIKFESNIKPKYGNYLLIIGRPIYEDHLFLKYLFDAIENTKMLNKFSRFLKPHPRENANAYKGLPINNLLPKTSFESIGEVPIGMIICFDSSSLLEIVGSGVEPSRVVNIKFQKKSIISELFNLNDIYYDGDLAEFQKSLEKRFTQFLEIYA